MGSEAGRGGILAIIPARGGSKRLPGKNLAPLRGRPLIAWTIDAALGSQSVDVTMVSTDAPEIAAAAREAGADTPFLRPAGLASDTASSFDVVRHALDFYREERGRVFEFALMLQPTSPLRTSADVEEAVRLLRSKHADAVVSVCEMEHSPLWSNTLPADGSLVGFLKPEARNKRSQDLPPYYRLNGALYLCRTERLLAERTFFLSDRIFAYVMPAERSVDIDTGLDLSFAEFLAGRN